jgi:hypothetical protein
VVQRGGWEGWGRACSVGSVGLFCSSAFLYIDGVDVVNGVEGVHVVVVLEVIVDVNVVEEMAGYHW